MSRLGPVGAAAALLLLALGCAGGPAPADHFYRLEAAAPSGGTLHLAGVVEVDRFEGTDLTRERAMLHADAPDAVELVPYRYHLWESSPTEAVQRALVRWLRQGGAADSVVTPDLRADPDWSITGRVARLEHLPSASAVLVELELALRDVRRGRLVVQGVYRVQEPAAGSRVEDAAVAFGSALTHAFERFAVDVEAARADGSSPPDPG